MTINVIIFEGNEHVDETNSTVITSWTKAGVIELLQEIGHWDETTASERVDWLAGDKCMEDTIEIVSANFIQLHGADAGCMIYIVRES